MNPIENLRHRDLDPANINLPHISDKQLHEIAIKVHEFTALHLRRSSLGNHLEKDEIPVSIDENHQLIIAFKEGVDYFSFKNGFTRTAKSSLATNPTALSKIKPAIENSVARFDDYLQACWILHENLEAFCEMIGTKI
ncbi:MAG: hypothetical protein ACOYK9_02600 [Chlamydiia bacterium]